MCRPTLIRGHQAVLLPSSRCPMTQTSAELCGSSSLSASVSTNTPTSKALPAKPVRLPATSHFSAHEAFGASRFAAAPKGGEERERAGGDDDEQEEDEGIRSQPLCPAFGAFLA